MNPLQGQSGAIDPLWFGFFVLFAFLMILFWWLFDGRPSNHIPDRQETASRVVIQELASREAPESTLRLDRPSP